MTVKIKYRVVKVGSRGGTFYWEDTETHERKSLFTKDEDEAERLVHAKNEAYRNPQLNRAMGMAYLSGTDPELVTRTWQDVMDDIIKDKHGPTLKRYQTALKDPALELIADRILVETQPAEFLKVLRVGTVSTNVYLRRLQNHAVDLDWLPKRVLPKKLFPKIKHKDQRGITQEEHAKIIARETNPERRDFYELCWHLGGSQSDIASLQGEDIDYQRRAFVYGRKKTRALGGMRIGPQAWEVILRRPQTGSLFPYLITVREADRATEFVTAQV